MAICVVCGKPVVTPAYTKDGTMRHVRCLRITAQSSRNLTRTRRRLIRSDRRNLVPEGGDDDD